VGGKKETRGEGTTTALPRGRVEEDKKRRAGEEGKGEKQSCKNFGPRGEIRAAETDVKKRLAAETKKIRGKGNWDTGLTSEGESLLQNAKRGACLNSRSAQDRLREKIKPAKRGRN